MSTTGLQAFDETVHLTNVWLKEIMEECGFEERHNAYRALRTTLHALRDRLSVELGAHLSAQLPLLVRGAFYEGWKPANCGQTERSRDAFLKPVADAFSEDVDADPAAIARGVFKVMQRHITAGEIAHVLKALPGSLRDIFE